MVWFSEIRNIPYVLSHTVMPLVDLVTKLFIKLPINKYVRANERHFKYVSHFVVLSMVRDYSNENYWPNRPKNNSAASYILTRLFSCRDTYHESNLISTLINISPKMHSQKCTNRLKIRNIIFTFARKVWERSTHCGYTQYTGPSLKAAIALKV